MRPTTPGSASRFFVDTVGGQAGNGNDQLVSSLEVLEIFRISRLYLLDRARDAAASASPLYSKASDHSSSRIPTARLQLTGYCSCRWTHCLRRGRSRAGSRANRFGALNGPIMMAACEPSTYPAGWRWIWTLAIALVTIFSNSARAWPQTLQPMPPGPPPNRKRPALTPVNPADEDFSFLRNPANRTDPWDPLKVPAA